eukprot:TRINITY_DN65680_c0_g1_i1.p1 TRINITY_DN65680_c0_g1~~TRINITY_DN65680_c0_g1_i1.p1  ORF type:complete len:119 (-),score=14.70 TRINITY_DN65680_c0_g1_i1:481-801(-)
MAVVDGPSWASNFLTALALDVVPVRIRGFEDLDLWMNMALEVGTHYVVTDISAGSIRNLLTNPIFFASRDRMIKESKRFAYQHMSLEKQLLQLWFVLQHLLELSDG